MAQFLKYTSITKILLVPDITENCDLVQSLCLFVFVNYGFNNKKIYFELFLSMDNMLLKKVRYFLV